MAISKILRADCLSQYPKFPTRMYEPKMNEEIISFPKSYFSHWYKIDFKSKRYLGKHLSAEIISVLRNLGVSELIFLGDDATPWISKHSKVREDYPPLRKSISYFESVKIGVKFNGGVNVSEHSLPDFLTHLYCLIRCGGPQPYIFFTDKKESFLGSIHYSAEIQLASLKKTYVEKMSAAVHNSNFKQTNR